MLRTSLFILGGNTAASLFGLLRNLLLARLLPVADFGIAATFVIILSIIEMLSAFGLQAQIIQARDGEDERFQSALQGFQLLRGVLSSILLFFLAAPMAAFMNLEDLVWAYQIVALVPLMNSLVHFDIQRLSRRMRFGPMIGHSTLPTVVSLLAVWPLVAWFGDYRAMLVVVIIQSATGLVTSHVLAERRYRVVFDRAIFRRSLAFGWPIMLNGVLLFGVFQGDRLIVGRELGVEALAVFSMAVTLTLNPMLVLTKTFQNLFLPLLSSAQDTPDRFAWLAAATLQITLLAGLVLVAAAVAVGQPLALFLLGDKYSGLLPLLSWMALIQALRMVNGGPAIVALALGETSNAMYANLARLVALPLIWYVAATSGDLLFVVKIGVAAEAAALAISLALLRYKAGVGLGSILPATLGTVPFGAVVMIQAAADRDLQAQFAPPGIILVMTALIAAALWKMPELRDYVRKRMRW